MPVYINIPGTPDWHRYPDAITNELFTTMLESNHINLEWRPFGIRLTPSDTPAYTQTTSVEGTQANQT